MGPKSVAWARKPVYRFQLFPLATIAAVLSMSACGGGGGGSSVGPSAPGAVRPNLPALALQTAATAHSAPILGLGAALHIGADVAPSANALGSVGHHRDVRVSYGRVADGIGAAELTAYLSADAENNVLQLYPDGYLYQFGDEPPIVRVAAGTTPELLDQTVRAVQLINAALPQNWQLRFSEIPLPASTERPAEGEILVEFTPRSNWPAFISGNYVGYARRWTAGGRTGNQGQPPVFTYRRRSSVG